MLDFFVKRPVAVSMIYGAILLLGLISLSRLKVSLFPDIVFPRLTVLTPYAGVAPEEIENLVTRPIEDAVSSVNGVRKILSRSQEGLSIIDVTLEWGTSPDLAVINMRQKVDLTRSVLPQDAGKSIIVKFDPSTDPIMTLVVRAKSMKFEDTRDYVEKNVRSYLERIPGVASLSILGGRRREIQINVDEKKMYGYGLSLDRIASALGSSNFNFPAGNVRRGDRELTVRIEGEFVNLPDISGTVVSVSERGVPVYLNQMAEVREGYREQRGATYHNGEKAIIIGIKKEPGKNTVETAENIRRALVDINKRFDRQLQLEIIQDRSGYISDAISSVRNAAIIGGIIAFVVLFLFLRDLRAALIIIVSIPVAILTTFVLMYLQGLSLNIMSLGGLAMGVGMLVDNAIVVLESIFHEREAAPAASSAATAAAGARRVAGSITASTLTSIAVFIPIIFVSGIAGAVFRDLALTVSYSLLSSLSCSLSLIPMLSSLDGGLPVHRHSPIELLNRSATPLFRLTEASVELLRSLYTRIVSHSLRRPAPVLGAAFALACVGALLLWTVPRSLFPEADQGIVYCELELPGGVTMEEAKRLHRRIHEFVRQQGVAVHSISNIGFDEDDLSSRIKGVRKANYSENVFYLNLQKISSREFIEIMDRGLTDTVSRKRFQIRGDAMQELLGDSGNLYIMEVESRERKSAREIAETLRAGAEKRKEVKSLVSSGVAGDPELSIFLDRDRIASFGLTVEAVARVIRSAIHGTVATVFREGDREIDIRVRLREEDRLNAARLREVHIQTPGEGIIALGSLIRPEKGTGYSTLLRRNQRRIEQLRIEYKKEGAEKLFAFLQKLRGETLNAFTKSVENVPEIRIRTENQETRDSLKNLFFAFLLSTILIYQLLAAQFESLLHPFTLAMSIPFMLFGVAASLLLTGHTMNVSSAMGMIMLVGIVVNSAIVLYEFIRQNREQTPNSSDETVLKEILIRSGRERLRPILLTTLTTLLGLIPMALGLGSGGDLQSPMAVVVIGGLAVSSVLTLIAFPTLYFTVERFRSRRGGGEV